MDLQGGEQAREREGETQERTQKYGGETVKWQLPLYTIFTICIGSMGVRHKSGGQARDISLYLTFSH